MQTSRQIEQTEPVIGDERLNFVIVPGDVRTTVAVARIWTCAPRRRSARRGGTQRALPARWVFKHARGADRQRLRVESTSVEVLAFEPYEQLARTRLRASG